MHSEDWDDVRFVLAVAETRTRSGAARELNVTHATVLRRIQSFEERHGGPIFERTAQGYRLLPERLRVIEAAREAARAMNAVDRLMRGGTGAIAGVVRLASTDTLCQTVLPEFVVEFTTKHPEMRIDLLQGNAHHDFGRSQADIAVRPAVKLPEDMEGESPCELGFAAYRRKGAEGWLGLTGQLARAAPAAWLEANVTQAELRGAADSFQVLARMVSEGQGTAILPCLLGDRITDAERLPQIFPERSVPLWVACHSDLQDVAHIRSVQQHLLQWLKKKAPAIGGHPLHG
jgi:DNA-binding transcriptional LysR family regulator